MITTSGKSSRPPVARKSRRSPIAKKSSHPLKGTSDEPKPLFPAGVAAAADGTKRKRPRKEEIVAEATRLFAERGYDGASMADLAKRVGLRKASLFHHFPSKDVLYATVLTELMDHVRAATLSAAVAGGSFAERLDGLTDALTSTLGAQPHAARLLMREAMDWGPVMKESLGRIINDVLGASLAFAKGGQKEGSFNPDLDLVHIIVSMVGIHVVPFVLCETIERFTGASPFRASFVDARKAAVRMQVRDLVLTRKET